MSHAGATDPSRSPHAAPAGELVPCGETPGLLTPTEEASPPAATAPDTGPARAGAGRLVRSWLRSTWAWVMTALAAVAGIAPHVLHHAGWLIGGAVVAGAAGTVAFGALGLLASVPMLLRLRRRFGSWWAPAIGVAVFAGMFAVSTLVIGPRLAGGAGTEPGPTTPTSTSTDAPDRPSGPADGHASHHPKAGS